MAMLVIAVPNAEMLRQAQNAVSAMKVDATVVQTTSATVVQTVRDLHEQGAAVAIARGNHAHLLTQSTDIPVIEIVLSGQNLARVFDEAKKLCPNKQRVTVGLIGFRNMFGELDTLADVLGIRVGCYFVRSSDEIPSAVDEARAANVDVVVGGEIALKRAQELHMTSLFLHSTQDSIETAISMAKRVMYAIDLEKHRTAEFMSLLDYSFDAILKLDDKGGILVANYMVEKLFGKTANELRGMNIAELLHLENTDSPLLKAIRDRRNVYAAIVRGGDQAFIANIASINVDSQSLGFILSLQEFQKIEQLEEEVRKARYNRGYVASTTFDDMRTVSPAMQDVYDTARKYAQYDVPVLLIGELGVGKHALAECIHNASMRRKNPFVTVDCGGLSPEMQRSRFMGPDGMLGEPVKGAFEIAHTGTLLIEHIDRLEENCQYQLLHVLRNKCIVRLDGKMMLPVNVRVIGTTGKSLYQCMLEGRFIEPLFCLLSQLELRVPTLREHAEDLPQLLNVYLEKYSAAYRKYLMLTPEARELIYCQQWVGNVLQLQLFCEKLTLLATEKEIGVDFVRKILPSSFDQTDAPRAGGARLPVICDSPEEAEIVRALEEHKGNRADVAEALQISKTTLWRKMKKYNIEKTYR